MTALIWFVVFMVFVFWVGFMAYKFRNPYKLIMVFGKKGSGKTTFLTKTAIQHLRKGYKVYSTVPIPGCYLFNVDDIGRCACEDKAVILIDEVGMIWDNRNFKNFRTDVRDYFKLQRHYHHKIYLFSQTFDIDVKLRNLCDTMYLCRCHMGFLSVARKIKRDITIIEPTGDTESRIADTLEFEPLLFSLFGAKTIIFTYIPNWVKFFNSFDAPELQPMAAEFFTPEQKIVKKLYGKHWRSLSASALAKPEGEALPPT